MYLPEENLVQMVTGTSIDHYVVTNRTFLNTSFKLMAGNLAHEFCHVIVDWYTAMETFDVSETNDSFVAWLEYCSASLLVLCAYA